MVLLFFFILMLVIFCSENVSDHDVPPKKKLKEVRLDRINRLFESYANRSSGFIE